jgi:Flp pilus assembly protein TadG
MNVIIEILVPSKARVRQAALVAPRPLAGTSALARLSHLLVSEEEGASLVEFALVSTILLLPLTTFIFVFGVFMVNQMQLINAVDVGARTLAINGGITLDPCSVASSSVINAAPGLNSTLLNFSYTLNGTRYSGTSCASATLLTGAAANLAGGTTATVTASYPCNLSIYGINFMPNGCFMKASTSELVQ